MNAELTKEANHLAEQEEQKRKDAGKGNAVKHLILPGQHETPETETPRDLLFRGEDERVGVEVVLEVANIKSATILADTVILPAEAEGLLLEHRELPICGEIEVALVADDHEVFRERFMLPTNRRSEVVDAHLELSKINEEFVTDAHKRDIAMGIYFPQLMDIVDVWYHIHVDEHHLLTYEVHTGPAHYQEIKKKIEGRLQL
ncbi:hypothetical protein KKH18_06135 [bacterium]|nr:hypothetical protein [bacterium]